MEQYAEVVLDLEGNAVPGATVQVFTLSGSPALIFDKNGNSLQGNAVVTGSRGEFSFQVPNGKYNLKVTVRGTVYAEVGPLTFYDPVDDQDRVTGNYFSSSDGASKVGTTKGNAAERFASIDIDLVGSTNVLRFIPVSEHAAIFSGTSTYSASADIQTAIDNSSGLLRLPTGKIRLGQQIVIRGRCAGLIGAGSYTSVLDKRFNGEAILSNTDGASLSQFGIDGNGSIYSGGGIRPQGYNNKIDQLRINDTADSCIIVNAAIGSNASAATYLKVDGCFLNPTNLFTTMAIRSIGVDDPGRPTCRVFSNLSGGSSLVDFSGMNYATLSDSLGTMVKFSATSAKIHMSGNRLTCQENITILGVDHVITKNSWGFGAGKSLSIDQSCTNVTFDGSNPISIDGIYGKSISVGHAIGGGMPCFITTGEVSYPFQWYGTVSNPVIGNGVATATYRLEGERCFVAMNMTTGSTTNVGSGVYTFQLPFKSDKIATGTAIVRASDGTYYPAAFLVQAGGNVGLIYLVAGATAPWGSSTISLGAGASLSVSIQYPLATQ